MRSQRVFAGVVFLICGITAFTRMGRVIADDPSMTPSETPSATATLTITPTWTPTSTQTFTPTPTWTPVIINVPVTVAVTQIVPIVITQVVQSTAVPYTAPPIVIPAPLNAPPTKAVIPRDPYASQLYGWRRHESIEFVQVLGQWGLRNTQNASDEAYHNTEDSGATLRFPFMGDGIRGGFRMQRSGGSFQIKIDNQIVGLYDTNIGDNASQSEAYSVVSEAYFLSAGYHVVDFITNGAPVGFDY